MTWLSDWVQNIVVVVIICTIIEMILPKGNNKKYIKMVISIFILFTIISPVISKITNKEFNLDSFDYEKYFTNTTYTVSTDTLEQNNEKNIENTYKQNIKADIIYRLKENGYIVSISSIDIEFKDERKYGKINELVLVVNSINKSNVNSTNKNNMEEIENVNEIDVNINNTSIESDNENRSLKESNIEEIKQCLKSAYEIDKENIKIT